MKTKKTPAPRRARNRVKKQPVAGARVLALALEIDRLRTVDPERHREIMSEVESLDDG